MIGINEINYLKNTYQNIKPRRILVTHKVPNDLFYYKSTILKILSSC